MEPVQNYELRTATTVEDKEAVYRLRYEIYVVQDERPLPSVDEMVSDVYDEYSTNFLVLGDERLIGTFRITDARKGQLEIENQSPSWNNRIKQLKSQYRDFAVEVTRFMVVDRFRKTKLLTICYQEVMEFCKKEGVLLIMAASKVPKHNKLHLAHGAEIEPACSCEYRVAGVNFGQYTLAKWDISEPTAYRELFRRKLDAE